MISTTFLVQALIFFAVWLLWRRLIPSGVIHRLVMYKRMQAVHYATVITDVRTGTRTVHRQRRKKNAQRRRYKQQQYRFGGAVRRESWRYVNAS